MQQTLQSIFEVIPEGIVILDAEGNEISSNQAMLDKVLQGKTMATIKVNVEKRKEERKGEEEQGIGDLKELNRNTASVPIHEVLINEQYEDGTPLEVEGPHKKIKMTLRKNSTVWMGKHAQLNMFIDNTAAREVEEAIAQETFQRMLLVSISH